MLIFPFDLGSVPRRLKSDKLISNLSPKVLNVKEYSKVHGVFPSTNSIPHLTKNSISLDPIRDSGGVVHHSCASELTHKEFRYLRTLIVEPPFIEFRSLFIDSKFFTQ